MNRFVLIMVLWGGEVAGTGEQVCLDHGVGGGGLLELVNRSVLIMGLWGEGCWNW